MRRLVDISTRKSLIVAPAEEPLLLPDVKKHLRFLSSSENVLIEGWMAAATQFFEEDTERQLITATWEYWLDAFPYNLIELPKSPLQEVLSIEYIDANGDLQSFSSGASPDVPYYQVQAPQGLAPEPGLIRPISGQSWPSTRTEMGAVRVRFKAGYGDTAASVPRLITTALYMLVGHFHKYRAEATDGKAEEVILGAKQITRRFKTIAVHYPPRRYATTADDDPDTGGTWG